MGFGQAFDNLTFNRMTSLGKKIQSFGNYFFELLLLATCNLKQILTMIAAQQPPIPAQ